MIFRIATKGGKLLITRDAGKAKQAILEGGKKASEKFIERIKNKAEYLRKLKQRFQTRKRKENDPVYKKKAAEKSARHYKHEMKLMHSPKYSRKAFEGEYKARQIERTMTTNPRVAGRTNPKSKSKIKGMPVQKKYKGGLLVKPRLAIGGY